MTPAVKAQFMCFLCVLANKKGINSFENIPSVLEAGLEPARTLLFIGF